MTVRINLDLSLKERTILFRRQQLARILKIVALVEDEKVLFDRIYPNGVPDSEIESAYELCRRTINKADKVSKMTLT